MIRDDILDALRHIGPMTMVEVTHHLGRERVSVFKAMRRLQAERLVYIKEWKRPERQGSRSPIYALGNRPDAKEPPPLTTSERERRYRERNRARISVRRYASRSTLVGMWAGLL